MPQMPHARDDDDYDIDFYTVGPVPPDVVESQAQTPSVREQLEVRSMYMSLVKGS